MADNFNFKQFLMENRLGAYSKAGLNQEAEEVPGGDNTFEAAIEKLGGQVAKRMTPTGETLGKYGLFTAHGTTLNGIRDMSYELSIYPDTKQIKARKVGAASNINQNIESVKVNGYVNLGNDNVKVPSDIHNYIKNNM